MASTIGRNVLPKVLVAFKPTSVAFPNFMKFHVCKNVGAPISLTAQNKMMTQPQAIGNPYYEEEQMNVRMAAAHIEAVNFWNGEVQILSEQMTYDDIGEDDNYPKYINQVREEQVKSLIDELIDEDLLDPRLRWTGEMN